MPARVKKARDKAKVEKSVQSIQRQVIAPLRKIKFFSLVEATDAFKQKLEVMNNKPFQKEPGSRWEKFEEEKELLRELPDQKFEVCTWKVATEIGRASCRERV